jgi:hypothetical protein
MSQPVEKALARVRIRTISQPVVRIGDGGFDRWETKRRKQHHRADYAISSQRGRERPAYLDRLRGRRVLAPTPGAGANLVVLEHPRPA